MEATERNWADKFARPLIAERQRVDTGNATAGDLQIFYAKQDPTSWTDASVGPSRPDAHGASRRRSANRRPAVAQAVVGRRDHRRGRHDCRDRALSGDRVSHRRFDHQAAAQDDRRASQYRRRRGRSDAPCQRDSGDELGEMGRWFNLFMAKLELLVTEVASSTHGVTGACENLFSVSHQMRVGAEETSAQANRRGGGVGAGDAQPSDRGGGHRRDERQHRRDLQERERRGRCRGAGGGTRAVGQHHHEPPRRIERRDRRSRQVDQLGGAANQDAGAERDHRGGARRRRGQGVCRRRQRGEGAGERDGEGGQADRPEDSGDSPPAPPAPWR